MIPNPAAPLAATTPPSGIASGSRSVALASLLGLIVLGLLWELVLAPTGQRTLVVKVLPLACALTGVLKFRLYTYRWLSLLVWIYFTEGVVRASGDHGIGAALAVIEIGLSLVLFTACAVHVRWRLRSRNPLKVPSQ